MHSANGTGRTGSAAGTDGEPNNAIEDGKPKIGETPVDIFSMFCENAFSGTVLHFDHRFLNAVATISPIPGSEMQISRPFGPKMAKAEIFNVNIR